MLHRRVRRRHVRRCTSADLPPRRSDVHDARVVLQRPVRAGDGASGRHQVHRRVQGQRTSVHARPGLLLARLLRRRVRRQALPAAERIVHDGGRVLLRRVHQRHLRDRRVELDVPADRRTMHVGPPAGMLPRDGGERSLRQRESRARRSAAVHPPAHDVPRAHRRVRGRRAVLQQAVRPRDEDLQAVVHRRRRSLRRQVQRRLRVGGVQRLLRRLLQQRRLFVDAAPGHGAHGQAGRRAVRDLGRMPNRPLPRGLLRVGGPMRTTGCGLAVAFVGVVFACGGSSQTDLEGTSPSPTPTPSASTGTQCDADASAACRSKKCDAKLGCVDCFADADCPAAQAKCEPTTKRCVGCLVDANCPASAPRCIENACRVASTTCATDGQCAGTKPHCDVTGGACVECLAQEHCAAAKPVCDGNRCVECGRDEDCPSSLPKCRSKTCTRQ